MKKVDIPVYGGVIHFTTSFDEYKRRYKKLTGEDIEYAAGWTSTEDDRAFLVGVFDDETQTLVHEIVHVAMTVLDRCGIQMLDGNGEPAAYLIDHLFGALNKIFENRKRNANGRHATT